MALQVSYVGALPVMSMSLQLLVIKACMMVIPLTVGLLLHFKWFSLNGIHVFRWSLALYGSLGKQQEPEAHIPQLCL